MIRRGIIKPNARKIKSSKMDILPLLFTCVGIIQPEQINSLPEEENLKKQGLKRILIPIDPVEVSQAGNSPELGISMLVA